MPLVRGEQRQRHPNRSEGPRPEAAGTESMRAVRQRTPSQPGRFPGAGGSAGDTEVLLRASGRNPRRGRVAARSEKDPPHRESPETIEAHRRVYGRESPEPPPGEGVARGIGSESDPDGERAGTGALGGADGHHRVIRTNATEPSGAKVRAQMPDTAYVSRSTAHSAGRMRSVGRRNRGPEKLSGASREATRGSVASRLWPGRHTPPRPARHVSDETSGMRRSALRDRPSANVYTRPQLQVRAL